MKWIFYICVFNFIHFSIQSDSVPGILLLLNFTISHEANLFLDGNVNRKYCLLNGWCYRHYHIYQKGLVKVTLYIPSIISRDSRGRDCIVVEFKTTRISAYHHWSWEFESYSGEVYSIKHHVIRFVSDLRQVAGFIRVLRFPPPIKLTDMI
jgi:hypothetical protein